MFCKTSSSSSRLDSCPSPFNVLRLILSGDRFLVNLVIKSKWNVLGEYLYPKSRGGSCDFKQGNSWHHQYTPMMILETEIVKTLLCSLGQDVFEAVQPNDSSREAVAACLLGSQSCTPHCGSPCPRVLMKQAPAARNRPGNSTTQGEHSSDWSKLIC